jgi:hypothetical protein
MDITELPLNKLQTIDGYDVLGIFAHQLHSTYGEKDKFLIIYRNFNDDLCNETVCNKGIKYRTFGGDSQFIVQKKEKVLYIKTKSQLLNEGWELIQIPKGPITSDDWTDKFIAVKRDKLSFKVHMDLFGEKLPTDCSISLDYIKHICVEK